MCIRDSAESDWVVGINATRALTCKYNAQLSCGRVQTPTLAMIAAREQEIRQLDVYKRQEIHLSVFNPDKRLLDAAFSHTE